MSAADRSDDQSRIGVADTTFARIDMYPFVEEIIGRSRIVRSTVPGIKDLPVACKRLFTNDGCAIVIALGQPGAKPIDKQCAHEASLGLQWVQIEQGKHILEVFVHLDEGDDEEVRAIAEDRARKHARNALALLEGKNALSARAGRGVRQGRQDEGPL